MLQVRHLLEQKEPALYSIAPDDAVLEAIRTMADHYVGALLVMRDDALVGIVSERDYARKVILMGRASNATPVSEIMTADVITVGPDETVRACMRLCTEQRVRHLPVVDHGKVVGIVSIGDLVKAMISEQGEQIEQLQRYIAG